MAMTSWRRLVLPRQKPAVGEGPSPQQRSNASATRGASGSDSPDAPRWTRALRPSNCFASASGAVTRRFARSVSGAAVLLISSTLRQYSKLGADPSQRAGVVAARGCERWTPKCLERARRDRSAGADGKRRQRQVAAPPRRSIRKNRADRSPTRRAAGLLRREDQPRPSTMRPLPPWNASQELTAGRCLVAGDLDGSLGPETVDLPPWLTHIGSMRTRAPP